MVCPRCGGKIRVVDSVNNTDENETYRRKKCDDCELVFYTTEYEVRRDQQLVYRWHKYHRNYL